MMRSWFDRGWWLLPVVLVALAAHAETLGYWFVATDTLPLIATSRVTDPAALAGLFAEPLMAGSDFTATTAQFYRPIASLTYAIDHALWGLNPTGYHLTNLLLHTVAAALVAVCTTTVTRRRAVGALAGILFAIHPVTAEVVPVTSRRQDTLLAIFVLVSLTLFVRWYRATAPGERFPWRWASHRPLVGALVAYGLALGAKETTVVVPVLVVVWVLLDRGIDRPRELLRSLFGTVGPFAAVTAVYLAVRIAVLGGFGGYSVPTSATLADRLLFAVKYLLWLVYPQNVVAELPVIGAAGVPSLVVLVAGVLLAGAVAVMALLRRGYFHRGRFRRLRALSPVASVVGFAAIPLVLAGESLGPVALLAVEGMLGEYLLGVLFVGACLAGLATALFAGSVTVGDAKRRQLVFFGCWVLVPLGLLLTQGFVTSKPLSFGFGMRNGYLAAVPAMAAVAVLVVPALERVLMAVRSLLTSERDAAPNTGDVVRVAAIGLLLVPVLGASPLLYAGDGWRSAGDLNERSLSGLDDALDGTSGSERIFIVNFPNEFDSGQQSGPHARSVTPLRAYSVETWLELNGIRVSEVRLVRSATVADLPDLAFHTEQRERATVVRVERTDDTRQQERAANAAPGAAVVG